MGVDFPRQVDSKQMEAARSSRSSSTDRDETEYDAKLRDVDVIDTTTPSDLQTGAKGESSAQHQAASCPQESPEATGRDEEDMAMKLGRTTYEGGLGDVMVPALRAMSGCSDCEETESDDDDDLCSTSSEDSDESSYNPLASGIMPPVLPVRLSCTLHCRTYSSECQWRMRTTFKE
jgi:hypothetical protein